MSYSLGVDLGTTFVAAAIANGTRVEMFTLGDRTVVTPAVVFARDDGTLVTGEAANRRAVSNPERVAREFKRRLGDPTPVILGGTPHAVTSLLGSLLADAIGRVTATEGGAPDSVVLTHPANWGPYRRELFEEVPQLAGVTDARMVTEPEAAAAHYAAARHLTDGDTVAVYDLGGGTFDATVLRKRAGGIDILGTPEGIERLGGVDFDDAILSHINYTSGGALSELDMSNPQTAIALARLRQDCILAKEALSVDTEATIPVFLPSKHFDVRLTRPEFEDMIRAQIESTIGALTRTLRSAHVEPAELSAVLLVGGSSRIPLVGQMITEALDRPTLVDAHPKYAVALGAATLAAEHAPSAGGAGAPAMAAAPPPPAAPPARQAPAREPQNGNGTGKGARTPAPVFAPPPPMAPAPALASPPPMAPAPAFASPPPMAPAPAFASPPPMAPAPAFASPPPMAPPSAPAAPEPAAAPAAAATIAAGRSNSNGADAFHAPSGFSTPYGSVEAPPRPEQARQAAMAAPPAAAPAYPDARSGDGGGRGPTTWQTDPPDRRNGTTFAPMPPVGSGPDGPSQPEPEPRRRGLIITAGVAVLLLLVGSAAYVLTRGGGSSAPSTTTPSQSAVVLPPPATAPPPQPLQIAASVPIPSVAGTIPVGKTPGFVAIAPNGKFAYIANRAAGVVTVVDTTIDKVVATIPIPDGPPQYVAFAPDGKRLYVSVFNDPDRSINRVAVLDTATNTVLTTIKVGSRPFALAVKPDGSELYVPNHDSGTVSVIDTKTNALVTNIQVKPNPHWVDFSKDGRFAYTANHESNLVSVIDTATRAVVAEIPVQNSPHSLAVAPSAPLVANVNYDSNSLTVIDQNTEKVIATVPVGLHPQDVSWSPDGRHLYVTAVDGNTMTVIATDGYKVTATIPTGKSPTSVAVLPDGSKGYITNLNDGTLTILDLDG